MSHRRAGTLVAAILLGHVAVALPDGALIYPHDNSRALAAPPLDPPGRLANPLFSDLSATIVPELAVHLRNEQSGWLATWNPHVELGRPMIQATGLGKAFLPTHLLSFVSDDPIAVHTLLVLLAVIGIAAFGYGFCASQGLAPVAAASAAIGLSLGVWVTWWQCFSLFLWGICWQLALLWALACFLRRASPASALAVLASVHALLLSGYPQQNVWALYVASGFAGWRLWRRGDPTSGKLRTLLQLLGLAALAVASVAPVFADLLTDSQRSTRAGHTHGFFLRSLVPLDDWGDAARFAARFFDAAWFGNPIAPDYPKPVLWGHSLGAPLAALAAASLLPSVARRAWGWLLLCATCLLLSTWTSGYLFAVDHLGLSLSRWTPLHSAQVPLAILAAHAVDGIARASRGERWIAAALAALPLGLALPGARLDGARLEPMAVAVGLTLLAVCLAGLLAARRSALLAAVTAGVFWYGQPMLLNRSTQEILRSSPLSQALAQATPPGARFAKLRTSAIPPNQEGWLGLRSIHTYDSLASSAYADWTRALDGRGMINFGRRFPELATPERVDPEQLARAGVASLVSRRPLPPELAAPQRREGRHWIGQSVRPPRLEAQLRRWSELGGDRVALPDEADASLPVTRAEDQADRLVFATRALAEPSLLFVSQQFHPHWRAFRGGEPLATRVVDDLFLGVLLPAGTDRVELRFLPWVRFAWLPQLGFALAAALLAGRALARRAVRE